MYLSGPNSSFVLGVKSNNHLNGAPIVCPPVKSAIDTSELSSFSIYSFHSLFITNDGVIKAIGTNKNNRIMADLPLELAKYTEIHIKDKEGNVCTPISVVCGNGYTLYLVSNKDQKRLLAYSSITIPDEHPIFLNIGNHNPIAIYGGENNSAAIDSEGKIIVIPKDLDSETGYEPSIVKLPQNEKANNVACLEKYLIVLTQSGKVFISPYQEFQFTEAKELAGIQITQISGVMLHCLAVSGDGRVFGFGSNRFGKLTLPKETKELDKFTELKAFGRSKIKAAFAGFQHSLFITFIGQLFACGLNKQGQLFLDRLSDDFIGKPVETSIKDGVSFCVAGNFCSVAFTGNVPPKMPNKNTVENKARMMRAKPLAAFPSLKAALKKV
ncbi:hypothetical protein M9Y10_015569 [Tritrichomonas musculus]|uniref:Regulator of chromosome condensation n=1 Tax=Tritrichomonas musculus TaxID=1915356 RepID=A0ABR2L2M5_9EUKA